MKYRPDYIYIRNRTYKGRDIRYSGVKAVMKAKHNVLSLQYLDNDNDEDEDEDEDEDMIMVITPLLLLLQPTI